MDSGELPEDWKDNITPLFKKGASFEPANYRPESVTLVCCKLLKYIIDSQLIKHLDQHRILSQNQHAFGEDVPVKSQLILTFNNLASNHNNNITTDTAVLEIFLKAFKVVHQKRLHKIDFYGIRDKTKNWIAAFLTNRLQRVPVNGKFSNWQKVLSGVPQATVLGPHLFLLFIHNIQAAVSGVTKYSLMTVLYIIKLLQRRI